MRASPLKISKQNLLNEALEKINIHADEAEAIKDNYGVVGYDIGDHILVAKPMLFNGHIVSCDRNKIMFNAIRRCTKILFYIQNHNTFYEFDPVEVNAHPASFINRRKTIEMVNFDIYLGKKLSCVDMFNKQLKLCIGV